MITEDRMAAFIQSLDGGNAPYLNELEYEAIKTDVPVIHAQIQSLIKLLLAVKKPVRILEVGTAIGFSTLFMSEYGPAGCEIVTIEKYEKRIERARKNFAKYGAGKKIVLLEGDAAEVLPSIETSFDLIFMDAAKGQYLSFFPQVLRLLKKEGMLISDNVLQGGDILESRYAITRRNRTIHSRMRDYLYELTHCAELCTSVLPIADGVAVSYKKT